jgi:hypothetical protein
MNDVRGVARAAMEAGPLLLLLLPPLPRGDGAARRRGMPRAATISPCFARQSWNTSSTKRTFFSAKRLARSCDTVSS